MGDQSVLSQYHEGIVRMRDAGKALKEIAAVCGVHFSTVSQYCKRHKIYKGSPGRKKSVTAYAKKKTIPCLIPSTLLNINPMKILIENEESID